MELLEKKVRKMFRLISKDTRTASLTCLRSGVFIMNLNIFYTFY